jgi:hypothetical protein
LRIRCEPFDRFCEIRPADQKALGSPHQKHFYTGLVDGLTRRTDPVNGSLEIEERIRGIAR